MIELRTLGSLNLLSAEHPDAQAVLAQPKRFALLAYLAVAAPGAFVRRDTLLALFWPDADQAHGRNVLRQTVYLLRHSLGTDAIKSRGDEEIGLDPSLVECDAARFESMLSAGRTAEALELYRGDFLDGFHVPDAAPELDEWIQAQARRLRRLAANASWSLAQSEEQHRNATGSAHWARRALSLDALNEKRLADVMQLLARIGDRAGALEVYREYLRRAELDLGIKPHSAVQRLAESMRNAPTDAPELFGSNAEIGVSEARNPNTAIPAPAAAVQSLARRPRRMLLSSVAALALIAFAGAMLHRPRGPEPQLVIAVGRITGISSDSSQPADVAADLLSTSLARLKGVHVIPFGRVTDVQAQLRAAARSTTSTLAAAQELGATYLIEGTAHGLGAGRFQLDLQMLDARNGLVSRVLRVQGSDLFVAIDQATSSVASGFGVDAPKENIAQVTTTSVIAYRLYDQGLQEYYQEDLPAAYRLFLAALGEDSTFAMAAYYAGATAASVARPQSYALLERAARLANRITDRERLLILEGVAQLGMSASASMLADTMAVRYPLDPDAQFVLGHVLVRRGDFLAAARQYRRVIVMDSLSLRLNGRCLACEAYRHLAWSYLFADSSAAAERVMREFAALRPGGGPFGMLAIILAREGRADDALRIVQAADSARPGTVNFDLSAAGLAIREGSFASADERLLRFLREGAGALRDDAAWYLVLSLRTQGRFREALPLSATLPGAVVRPLVLLEMGKAFDAARGFESLVSGLNASPYPGHRAKHQAWVLTHVATSLAAAGDTSRLQALADSVERIGKLSAWGRDPRLHHYIRGLLWSARHQPAQAAAEFRKSIWSWSEGYTRANYELARALIAINKSADAIYPLQAALRGDIESSNLYVSRTELHELLARSFDQLGQMDSATVHYRAVVKAWSKCDSILRPRFDAAKARLAVASASTITLAPTPKEVLQR